MQFTVQPVSVGFILAIVSLVIVLVLCVTGQMPFLWIGAVLLMLCVSRLV
jgi:hypothetical protein